MDISELTVKLLLLFFPGIVCALIVDYLTVHRPKIPFFFMLWSFVYGLSSYLFYWVLVRLLHVVMPRKLQGSVTFLRSLIEKDARISFREILFVAVLAVLLGLCFSWISTHKIISKTTHRLGITKKFEGLDVWDYTFNMDATEWATVRDHENDLMYDGWVYAFSDDSQDAELLMRDVSVYTNSTAEKLYQVGAAYISRKRESMTIEFGSIPIDPAIRWKEE